MYYLNLANYVMSEPKFAVTKIFFFAVHTLSPSLQVHTLKSGPEAPAGLSCLGNLCVLTVHMKCIG